MSRSAAPLPSPPVEQLLHTLPEDLRTHSERVARLCAPVGVALHLSAGDRSALHLAALLHDVGKRHLPTELLDKPGPLTPDEWGLMRQHPDWSVQDAQGLDLPAQVLPAVAAHHERWDGRGYPRGLRGTEISPLACILSVCDVFDALVSVRSYKPAWSPHAAWAELRRGRERAFCPQVLDAFLSVHAALPDLRWRPE
jgi:HD-GYP domain-containing protein (c-di-GMP phosphodiesterase class II)